MFCGASTQFHGYVIVVHVSPDHNQLLIHDNIDQNEHRHYIARNAVEMSPCLEIRVRNKIYISYMMWVIKRTASLSAQSIRLTEW